LHLKPRREGFKSGIKALKINQACTSLGLEDLLIYSLRMCFFLFLLWFWVPKVYNHPIVCFFKHSEDNMSEKTPSFWLNKNLLHARL